MDLKQLQTLGAFVPMKLIERDVKFKRPVMKPQSAWKDPEMQEYIPDKFVDEKWTLYFRKRASADFMEMVASENRDRASVAMLRCVCNKDGTQFFPSIDVVNRLEDWFFLPVMAVVMEVNKYGPKSSPSKTSSGANSRSASAGGRSKNGNKRSAKKSAPSGSLTTPSAAP